MEWTKVFLIAPIARAWQFRELIKAILFRELAARFRGSAFGWMWAVAAPVFQMLIYTVVFSGIVMVARPMHPTPFGTRALIVFSGITVFNLFLELLLRAPGLLHEHAGFIKKSIFPTETLAWIAVFRALVYSGVSFAVLLVFEVVMTHQLPLTVLMVPVVLAPIILLLLGVTWFLMALGAFTRDISHLVATVVPVFMWITPVFYASSDAPAGARGWMLFNIMGDYIELFRDVVLRGLPLTQNLDLFLICSGISYVVFIGGYTVFMRYKSIIVDVI
jgi:lipopolysaccharide transport system permease protein